MRTILLLILSNSFMTLAWYGHLRFKTAPLLVTILVSWLIALPEYALQVPANRLGYGQFTAAQLKIIQEAISISVFIIFCFFYLKEAPTWRTGLAMMLILAAVALAVPPSYTGRSTEQANLPAADNSDP
ncbi:MAG TPA: DMT family protein [Gemmataceae bacterium]|jgi:uncharacterized protein (DUF486 family)|nr:DMT family protein [Gemmataceae bacterium]